MSCIAPGSQLQDFSFPSRYCLAAGGGGSRACSGNYLGDWHIFARRRPSCTWSIPPMELVPQAEKKHVFQHSAHENSPACAQILCTRDLELATNVTARAPSRASTRALACPAADTGHEDPLASLPRQAALPGRELGFGITTGSLEMVQKRNHRCRADVR